MGRNVKIIVRFVDSDENPVFGDNYKVKLYDNDPVIDDFLGESSLNRNGQAEFVFETMDFKSFDSLFEDKPDFYFSLYKDNSVIFESKVKKDIDLLEYLSENKNYDFELDFKTIKIGVSI